MRRRLFLATTVSVALGGCAGRSDGPPEPPATDGDDESPFEIAPHETTPLALAPGKDDIPVVDERWGADNTSYEHYPLSHTRTFSGEDQAVTFTIRTFDSVEESAEFVRNERWTDESYAELQDHEIGSGGYFYGVEPGVHVVFRDANALARVTYTNDSSGPLFGRGIPEEDYTKTFEMAVALHESWR